MDHGDYWGGFHQGPGALGMILFVLAVIALAVLLWYLVTRLAAARHVPVVVAPAATDALALVRLRYARGEIDRDTFLQTTADLGGEPPPATA